MRKAGFFPNIWLFVDFLLKLSDRWINKMILLLMPFSYARMGVTTLVLSDDNVYTSDNDWTTTADR